MFSGIITEVSFIRKMTRKAGSYELVIKSDMISSSSREGDSIAVDGVCLTLKNNDKNKGLLAFDIMEITFKDTRFKYITRNEKVNLEKALEFGVSVSGHLVQGHVDAVAEVNRIKIAKDIATLEIKIPEQFNKLILKKGSIAINGVSLTIQDMKGKIISVGIIPYTLSATNLKDLRTRSFVNIEFDLFAKYIVNYIENSKYLR